MGPERTMARLEPNRGARNTVDETGTVAESASGLRLGLDLDVRP